MMKLHINPDKLKLVMARKSMNTMRLCEITELKYQSFQRISTGNYNSRPETVGKIATALGVDVTEIIDLEEPLRQLPKETPDSIDEQ